MSKTVDTRVVEMRFDNKQFENGVKTSLSTLEKLKSSLKLDGAAKGLENLDKAANSVSFDGIASGVAALEKRFSTLGIVGMRVVENLTDSAMKTLGKMTNFINDGIIQGGKNRAMNLENAHFQLQGLLKDEEAVNAVMKNVNDSVDGTAYSLDAAAKVASQLAASGMRAGDGMFSALRGVAGVAAMTNSTYEDIGRIYTQVAGQGRLMGDQLLQLSGRGMNAAATLAEYLGKTEGEVREMVSKGKIDFATFASAMDTAFGEHAKKANETFTGAMSNIKAALARIGALFISPLVVQNGALVQLFNVIRERINDIKNSIGPVADTFVNAVTAMANALTAFLSKVDIKTPLEKLSKLFTSKWSQFEKKINDVGITTDDFQSKLKEVANEHGISLDELMNKYGSLKKVISSGKISKNIIIDTLKKISDAGNSISDVTSKLETFNKITGQIINGDFKNGAERVQALTNAGYDYATMQKLVNYVWERNGHTWTDCSISAEELTNVLGDLSQEELQSIGYTEEQAEKLRQLADEAEKTGTPLNELITKLQKPSGKELIIDSLKNALTGLSGIMQAVKKAWLEMVSPLSTSVFSSIAEKIHNFSKKLVLTEEKIDVLKRAFKGLFAALDLVRGIISGALGTAFKVISAILSSFNVSVLDAVAYVSDAVVKLRDWIKEHNFLKKILDAIVPVIKSVATAIYDWVKNNELIQNGIKKISSLLDSASAKIGKWVDGLKETDNIPKYIVSGLINGIKSGISTAAEVMVEFGKAILNAIKNVLGIHSPSKEFFEIGRNVIAGFINGIKSGISSLLSLLGDVGQKCIDILKNIDFGKIFAVGISASIIYIADDILKVIKMFAAPAAGIGKMTSSIGGFFDALSERIKPNKLKNVSSAVRDFAIAIGILAGSVYVLAQLDAGKMWSAVGALAALSGVIAMLSLAASKIDASGGNFKQLSLMIVGISGALYLMASAMKKLDFLNSENMGSVLGGFTAMIAGFTAILLAMSILANSPEKKDISKVGLIVLEISAAMLLMTKVVKSISEFDNGALTKGIGCMTLFGVLITGLMAATKLIGKDANSIGSNLLKISASMFLMIGVIKAISKLEPGAIAKGITCMVLFGGLITGLMAATKLVGKDVGKIGSTILGVSAAMTLMVLTIKMVANMEPASIVKGVACIAAFGGIVTGLVAATRLAGGNDLKGVSATLLSMSIAIGILGAVAIGLSLIDTKNLAKGIVAVGMLSGMMALMVHATKNAQNCKGNIIALTVAIGLMAAAIVALSFIDGKKLAGATIALGTVMGMFALMEKAASSANKAIPSIVVMTVAVGLLAGMLALLSKIPSKALLASSASLSLLLLAISVSFAIISKTGGIAMSAVGALALMGLVVGELAIILGLMSKFNVEPSIETAASLSLLLLAMSASLVLLAAVGATGPAAFIGIGALAALIAAIGGLMIGIGALMEYVPGMQQWLDTGMVVLEKIGYGLGSFFGNIAGGFLDGASSGLPAVGENLSAFMESAKPFLDGVSNLNEDSLKGVESLVGIVTALTAANFIDGLTSWLTGGSSFDEFGNKLVPFGETIKSYAETVKDIDTSGVEASVVAGKALAELASALPNSGGLAGFFAGENDINDFGSKIVPFGTAIKTYCERVQGIDASGVEASVIAGKAIAELASALPNSGGVAGFFAGDNDVDTFGNKIVSFGNSIVEYCNTVAEINIGGVDTSLDAAKKILELTGILSDNGLNVVNFCEGMKNVGKCLVDFSKQISDVDFSNVGNIVASLHSLGTTGIESFVGAFAGAEQNLSQIGVGLITALISGIISKSPEVSRAAMNIVTTAATGIRSKYQSFYDAGKYVVQGFANGISANSYLATAQASAMAKAADTAARAVLGVQSPSRAFMTIGRYIGEGLAIGIRDSAYKSVYETESTADKIKNVAKKKFEDIEKWVDDAKFFDELSLAEELELWESVISKYAEGTEERTKAEKNAYSVYKELREADYQNSVTWINKEKEYNRLSLQEEIDAWKRVQERYIEGTEERIEIDKKLYDLKHQQIDGSITLIDKEISKQKELISTLEEGTVAYANAAKELEYLNKLRADASYQHSEDWMSEEEAYDRLDLSSKLAARRRMLKDHKNDPEAVKKLNREIYKLEKEINTKYKQYVKDKESIDSDYAQKRIDLEKEYYDKEKEINDKLVEDIKNVNKEYDDALKSRTDSLYKSYGLFDEISKKDKVSANKLFRNLQDQTAEFEDWMDTLNLLQGRGLNEALIEELQEMGPSAIEQIKALNSMSDSQLAQYANLWSDKHKLAKEQATDELEGLRVGTQQQIKDLEAEAAEELSYYKGVWDENLSELNLECQTKLEELQTTFKKEVGIIKSGTEEEIAEMTANVKSIMTEAGWNEVGQEIINGITVGIEDKKPILKAAVTSAATMLISCFKTPLQINSPSKVFIEFGHYIVEGLIVGIKNLFGRVSDTAGNLGETTLDAVASTIGRISDMVDGDIHINPTISPVVDLSNVNRSLSQMNSGFYANRSVELGMRLQVANQNGAISQMNENVSKLAEANMSSNSKLSDAIDGLRNDFNNLVDTVSKMQLVMDSGALVGAISPGMDRSLGVASVMKRRGV